MCFYRCSNCESRVAAYRLLIELAKGNYSMLKDVCKQLIEMHHLPQPDCANEWEVRKISKTQRFHMQPSMVHLNIHVTETWVIIDGLNFIL